MRQMYAGKIYMCTLQEYLMQLYFSYTEQHVCLYGTACFLIRNSMFSYTEQHVFALIFTYFCFSLNFFYPILVLAHSSVGTVLTQVGLVMEHVRLLHDI